MNYTNSPIEQITFNKQRYFIKRDDLLDVDFSGNKARKFYYFLKNDFPKIKKIVSSGSAQSNAMYSLSVLCKLKNLEFDYYVDHIASFLKENPSGNYQSALKNKMNIKEDELIEKLSKDEKYINHFNEVFKEENSLNFINIQKSIAAYVKILLTRSSFDEFLEGDNNAISATAKRGLVNFMNFGCAGCHTGMSVGGQSVQRFPLRQFAGIHDLRPNLGSPPDFEIIDDTFPFENKGGYKGRADTHFFRVPILRNVTKTSPYFHNGSVDKIREAVEIMGRHQVGLNLSNQQIDEIVEFLKTLEGNVVDYTKDVKVNK